MTTRQSNDKWVERFGALASFKKLRGKNGAYAIFTIDCKTFQQQGIVFDASAVAAMEAAEIGASVWMKGPLQVRQVEKDGETVDETSLKAVYFKLREPKPVIADDLTVLKGIGASVAEKLTAQGVITYAMLAGLSDEALVALDASVSAVRGGLIRAGVREAAQAILAAAETARLERTNAFA